MATYTLLFLALLSLVSSSASQLAANIYILDQSSSSANTADDTPAVGPSLSCSELNVLLSHHLDISHYETLPVTLYPHTRKAQFVFGSVNAKIEVEPHGRKSLIVIYGSDGQNLLTEKFVRSAKHFSLPAPPDSLSFDGLISTYVGRIVQSFKTPISSIYGVKDFLDAYLRGAGGELLESLHDWAQQWEDSLDDWLDWGKDCVHIAEAKGNNPHSHMLKQEEYSRWLNEYGVMDASAKQFLQDLESLDRYLESASSSSSPVSLIRLSGLEQIVRHHGQNSPQYRGASAMLKKFLDALLSSSSVQAKTILISVPPKPAHTRLGKRTSFSALAPFQTSGNSFVNRALLERRSEIFAGGPRSIPIISSSRKCFSNVSECESATESCNRHGRCVSGQRTSGGTCFVCECGKAADSAGKLVGWSGEMCQKQDISSEFVLLSGSVIGLIVACSMAIALLFSIGAEGLPQQLASVSGSNKKND